MVTSRDNYRTSTTLQNSTDFDLQNITTTTDNSDFPNTNDLNIVLSKEEIEMIDSFARSLNPYNLNLAKRYGAHIVRKFGYTQSNIDSIFNINLTFLDYVPPYSANEMQAKFSELILYVRSLKKFSELEHNLSDRWKAYKYLATLRNRYSSISIYVESFTDYAMDMIEYFSLVNMRINVFMQQMLLQLKELLMYIQSGEKAIKLAEDNNIASPNEVADANRRLASMATFYTSVQNLKCVFSHFSDVYHSVGKIKSHIDETTTKLTSYNSSLSHTSHEVCHLLDMANFVKSHGFFDDIKAFIFQLTHKQTDSLLVSADFNSSQFNESKFSAALSSLVANVDSLFSLLVNFDPKSELCNIILNQDVPNIIKSDT